MNEIIISRENVVKAYKSATPKQKKLLTDLFGSQFLDLADRVTSYEDACAIQCIKPLTLSDFSFLPESARIRTFANHQLDIIIDTLNEGHEFDYNNSDERKWFPVFEAAGGGSGFALGVVYCVGSSTSVGPRRSFVSEEHARYAGIQFIHLYNQSFERK